MTIRLTTHANLPRVMHQVSGCYPIKSVGSPMILAYCDTPDEAEQARLAFEQVLLPRFTRDEAIALCVKVGANSIVGSDYARGVRAGFRKALEALAAAGVFSDSPCTDSNDTNRGVHPAMRAQLAQAMAAKLDAAGIR